MLARMNRIRTLENYLSGKLDRRVTTKDAAELVELGRQRYAERRDDGTITADMVMTAAHKLDLNPVIVLLDMGYITEHQLAEASTYAGVTDVTTTESPPKPRMKPKLRADWPRPL